MTQPTSLVLIDDHALFRAGIRTLLENTGQFIVVGETSDAKEAICLAEHKPDIMLLDINIPHISGLEIARRIQQLVEPPSIAFLTMHDEFEYIDAAIRLKASGYLLKDTSPEELVMALDNIKSGLHYYSPIIFHHIISGYQNNHRDLILKKEDLSQRQLDILKRIASGQSTKEIAKELDLSPKTIETHRGRLMLRVGVHDVASLINYAHRQKWLD